MYLKMAVPCALVASCCSLSPSEIIKQILGTEKLPPATHITDGIEGYPWSIANKYYTADVNICSTPCKTIGDAEFAERLEAVIIVFNDKESSFESVKQWIPFVNQLSPTTQILACQRFTLSGEVSRHTAQLWCLDNSFELVELERGEDEEDEEEDEYDITGVRRIISALHAHTWSNLELKENRQTFGLLPSEMLNGNRQRSPEESLLSDSRDVKNPEAGSQNRPEETHGAPDGGSDIRVNHLNGLTCSNTSKDHSAGEETNEQTKDCNDEQNSHMSDAEHKNKDGNDGATASTQDRIDNLLNDDMELFRQLGMDDPGEESFEGLFSRMAAMKERAAGLSGEERKRYAEKVAVSFWRALGGDEEEVDGLEDSD